MAEYCPEFIRQHGVNVDEISLELVRPNDIITIYTPGVDYHLLITEPSGRGGFNVVGYLRTQARDSLDPDSEWELLRYQMELRGGCRAVEKTYDSGEQRKTLRMPAAGIKQKLTLGNSLYLVDRSGEGGVCITSPITRLDWLVAPTDVAN